MNNVVINHIDEATIRGVERFPCHEVILVPYHGKPHLLVIQKVDPDLNKSGKIGLSGGNRRINEYITSYPNGQKLTYRVPEDRSCAAYREVMEEIGIPEKDIIYLEHTHIDMFYKNAGVIAGVLAPKDHPLKTDKDLENYINGLKVDPKEVSAVMLLSLDKFTDLKLKKSIKLFREDTREEIENIDKDAYKAKYSGLMKSRHDLTQEDDGVVAVKVFYKRLEQEDFSFVRGNIIPTSDNKKLKMTYPLQIICGLAAAEKELQHMASKGHRHTGPFNTLELLSDINECLESHHHEVSPQKIAKRDFTHNFA